MSVSTRKKTSNAITKGRKKQLQPAPEAASPAAVQPAAKTAGSDFERELQDHFAAEARKKVEEAAENLFGGVLARYGWVRNEHGQVEYIGGEGAA